MRKIAVLIAALSLLALTGCGEKADKAARVEETTAETASLSDAEKLQRLKETSIKRLGLTASELPEEALEVPDDWEQLTVNGVTVRLPADFTVDAEDSTVYDFRCNDVKGYVCFSDDGDVDVNELYKTMMDMADLKKVFGSFGLEFDGTTRSMFGNFLKLSEEDIRSADEKTRDELTNFGGLFFFTEKAYDVEKSGCELFISDMKDSLRDDEGNDAYSVDIFDDNSELSVITVNCKDELTALRIAASADLQ